MHLSLPDVGTQEVESFTRKRRRYLQQTYNSSHENLIYTATRAGGPRLVRVDPFTGSGAVLLVAMRQPGTEGMTRRPNYPTISIHSSLRRRK